MINVHRNEEIKETHAMQRHHKPPRFSKNCSRELFFKTLVENEKDRCQNWCDE